MCVSHYYVWVIWSMIQKLIIYNIWIMTPNIIAMLWNLDTSYFLISSMWTPEVNTVKAPHTEPSLGYWRREGGGGRVWDCWQLCAMLRWWWWGGRVCTGAPDSRTGSAHCPPSLHTTGTPTPPTSDICGKPLPWELYDQPINEEY